METSEARKRRTEAEAAVARHEQRREVLQQALACVWSGADFTDADCVLIALDDLGGRVEVDQ